MHLIPALRLCFALAGALAAPSFVSAAQPEVFREWPVGSSPAEVGRKLAANWAAREFEYVTRDSRRFIIYPEVCTWYGALRVATLTKDDDLKNKLVAKFDSFLTPAGAERINRRPHVDHNVFGIVPYELYLITKDDRHLALGNEMADGQWATTTPDGITSQARYWIDDMYMIPALQVQAFRATKDPKYLDRAANTMAAYLDKLQQANGLFHHAPDSPYFWGRGNGWIAAGAAELLAELPADHPKRARILEGARKMVAELLKHQSPDGVWRQLVDKPASWAETSGTAMFTFAMISGVTDGWLDAATYGPAARKAWLALVGYLEPDGNIREVCIGTNKGFSEQYYMDRPRRTGDLHGQAPMLWCAMALLK